MNYPITLTADKANALRLVKQNLEKVSNLLKRCGPDEVNTVHICAITILINSISLGEILGEETFTRN